MKYLFKWEDGQSNDSGLPGWVHDPNPDNFDPCGGLTIAHDIFEEFECSQYIQLGHVHNELMAFGAMYWLRASTSWFEMRSTYYHNHTWIDSMKVQWTDMLEHIKEGLPFKRPPYFTTSTSPIKDDNGTVDADLMLLCEAGVNFIRDESGNEDVEKYSSELNDFIYWLRIGYRRAKRRYVNCDKHQLAYLFTEVMEAVDRVTYTERKGSWDTPSTNFEQGDKMIIRVCFQNYTSSVEIVRQYD